MIDLPSSFAGSGFFQDEWEQRLADQSKVLDDMMRNKAQIATAPYEAPLPALPSPEGSNAGLASGISSAFSSIIGAATKKSDSSQSNNRSSTKSSPSTSYWNPGSAVSFSWPSITESYTRRWN